MFEDCACLTIYQAHMSSRMLSAEYIFEEQAKIDQLSINSIKQLDTLVASRTRGHDFERQIHQRSF